MLGSSARAAARVEFKVGQRGYGRVRVTLRSSASRFRSGLLRRPGRWSPRDDPRPPYTAGLRTALGNSPSDKDRARVDGALCYAVSTLKDIIWHAMNLEKWKSSSKYLFFRHILLQTLIKILSLLMFFF